MAIIFRGGRADLTIYEFAEHMSLSVATISKVFNGYSDVSARTRARVLLEAKRLDFEPLMAAKTISTKKSLLIGIIYSETTGEGLMHPHFSEILEHFKRTMEAQDYSILFLNKDHPSQSMRTLMQQCKYRALDGVMIMAEDPSAPQTNEVLKSDLPAVLVDFEFTNRSSVLSDNALGMHLVVDHLYALGHRKFAYVTAPLNHPSAGERFKAFRDALGRYDLTIPDEAVVGQTGYTFNDGCRAIKQLPDDLCGATAVVCSYDRLAFGVIHQLQERGLRAPEDISVTGFDNLVSDQMDFWNLTTIEQPRADIGAEAGRLLLREIADGDRTPVRLPVRLIVRGTTGCRGGL